MSEPEPVKVDFSNRKVNSRTSVLKNLKSGESYIHDHTDMKTPFAIWLATRRSRMARDFRYSTKDEDGSELPSGWYRIFIP